MTGEPPGAGAAGSQARWQTEARAAHGRRPPPAPRLANWLYALVAGLLLIVLIAGYVGAANLLVDRYEAEPGTTQDRRDDAVYFALHGVTLAVGTVTAVAVAGALRRSRWGLGLLVTALLLLAMSFAQVITFHLACEGHNDIVRHWQCEP